MILNTLFGAQMAPERTLAPANQPVSQVEGGGSAARPAGIGGFLGQLRDRWTTPNAQGLDFGQRLTRFGAELQDISDGGQRAAAINQRMEAQRQQQAASARQQQASAAFQAALRPDGSFDGRAYLSAMAQAGQAPEMSDIAAAERMGQDQIVEGPDGIYRITPDGRSERIQDYPTPRPKIYNGDINGDGVNDIALEDDVYRMLGVGGPQGQSPMRAPQGQEPPPPPGFSIIRPNQAASPTGAVAATGQGFTNYGQIEGFLTEMFPGSRITGKGRSQAVQDDFVRRGLSPTRNSTHVEGRGLGTDFVPPVPFDQWNDYAERLRSTGRFRRVRVETGRGRNQGTGAHIHLEPIVGR